MIVIVKLLERVWNRFLIRGQKIFGICKVCVRVFNLNSAPFPCFQSGAPLCDCSAHNTYQRNRSSFRSNLSPFSQAIRVIYINKEDVCDNYCSTRLVAGRAQEEDATDQGGNGKVQR